MSPPPSDEYVTNLRDQEHILRALNAANDRWLEVAELAFESPDLETCVSRIAELLDIDYVQAGAVADTSIRRTNLAGRKNLRVRLNEVRDELRDIRQTQTE